MKRLSVVTALVLSGSLASGVSAAPSPNAMAKRIKRLESQVARLDARLTATVALATTPPTATSTVVTAPMLQELPGSGYYRGAAACPPGTTLAGGGVDSASGTGGQPRVVASAPTLFGARWNGEIFTPGSQPTVYVVCLSVQ
jgi:hypothetical protein